MKFYTSMPLKLKPFYTQELSASKDALNKKHYQVSWHHLERAHIIGQPYPFQHTAVHWKMFIFGIRLKNFKEILGQIPRLLVGGVKSFVGKIPVGNTGGADVPPLRTMEIPDDLKQIIRQHSKD